MTIEKLINELKNYGYDISFDGENLRYRFDSLITPPEERIEFLLFSLKRNKPEVVAYLRAQENPNSATSSDDVGVCIQEMTLSEFGKAGLVVKVFSEVLNDHVYFVSDDAVITLNQLDLVAYSARELEAMLDMTPEEVQAVHEVKQLFHKGRVIAHRRVTA